MQKNSKGIFISFEGGDGAGKSTQILKLCDKLESIGRQTLVIREPGGTKIGEKVRDILLDKNNQEMYNETELLLYEASRAQIVHEKIIPALNKGVVVLADRFYDSSLAYQGYARGLSKNAINNLNMFATSNLKPHKTILIVTNNTKQSLKMATKKTEADRIEAEGTDFQDKVINGFKKMAEQEPNRFITINQQKEKSDTFKLI